MPEENINLNQDQDLEELDVGLDLKAVVHALDRSLESTEGQDQTAEGVKMKRKALDIFD